MRYVIVRFIIFINFIFFRIILGKQKAATVATDNSKLFIGYKMINASELNICLFRRAQRAAVMVNHKLLSLGFCPELQQYVACYHKEE